jgi:hypothetical protein
MLHFRSTSYQDHYVLQETCRQAPPCSIQSSLNPRWPNPRQSLTNTFPHLATALGRAPWCRARKACFTGLYS